VDVFGQDIAKETDHLAGFIVLGQKITHTFKKNHGVSQCLSLQISVHNCYLSDISGKYQPHIDVLGTINHTFATHKTPQHINLPPFLRFPPACAQNRLLF
jgi:hypothetical protein